MSRTKPHKSPKDRASTEPAAELMDFGAFRKHHKVILWVTVVLTSSPSP